MNPEKSPLLLASARDLLSFSLENKKFVRNEKFSQTACSCVKDWGGKRLDLKALVSFSLCNATHRCSSRRNNLGR